MSTINITAMITFSQIIDAIERAVLSNSHLAAADFCMRDAKILLRAGELITELLHEEATNILDELEKSTEKEIDNDVK